MPPQPVDTVVIIGVLEYVKDYSTFFCSLRRYNSEVVLFSQLLPFGKSTFESSGELGAKGARSHTSKSGVATRHNNLFFHELVDAAREEGGFVVSNAQYHNVLYSIYI